MQEWQKLAYYIADNDSSQLSLKREPVKYTADSIRKWISQKDRRRIDVKNRLPLFIRYFTCEGSGERSVSTKTYTERMILIEKYFVKNNPGQVAINSIFKSMTDRYIRIRSSAFTVFSDAGTSFLSG